MEVKYHNFQSFSRIVYRKRRLRQHKIYRKILQKEII